MKFGRIVLALAVCIVANVASARAAIFEFSFTNEGTTFGSGDFTTSGAGSPFSITGVSGTVTYMGGIEQVITGVKLFDMYAGNDNLLNFPAAPEPTTPAFVTYGGVSFTTSADVYNIGFADPIYNIEQQSTNPGGTINPGDIFVPLTGFTVTAVSAIAAVPEPSTWVMMILGFGALGFMGYRRRGSQPSISIG
jgi:hypothetical protein